MTQKPALNTWNLSSNENIVDRDVNQLHEIAHKSHGDKTDRRRSSRLSEFYPSLQNENGTLLVGLRAFVHEEFAVTNKVLHGLNDIGFNCHDLSWKEENAIPCPNKRYGAFGSIDPI